MLDLAESPYEDYVSRLERLRRERSEWARVAYHEAREDQRGTHDQNEQVVVLRAARAAADKWGDPADIETLDRAIVEEETRIEDGR